MGTERTITPINPATGRQLSPVGAASEAEVLDAVSRSRRAFATWRFTSVKERSAFLVSAAECLEAAADEIGGVITSEMGRVKAESIPEVTKSGAFLRYFARIGERALTPTRLDLEGLTLPEKEAYVHYEPRGVVAVIKPWNAPVQQIIWAVAPALMAGCTVIIKPSEYTPRSALGLQRAFDKAGLPKDVVITLTGDDRTGEFLVGSDVDVIAFTGSVATGRRVAEIAGRRLKKAILELSGKDALIVDQNPPDLTLVASGIVYGAFSNCGHWCSSIERAYIPSALWDSVLPKVVEKTRALRVGDGSTDGVDMGPIANERQFSIVKDIVADAVSRGATVVAGGKPSADSSAGGYFFEPTVLTDVPHDARLTHENVFGPVIALYRYDKLDDAILAANSTNYGLGLSLWTADPEVAEYVTKRSDTGMVWVNEPLQSLAACPWSVYKDSGIGVELGESGLREFTFEKVVQAQFANNSGPRAWYFPYGK
ncbi:aldehyde dehydrogenase family protein [Nocardia vinacea]|uniref:aldehyde dehydrogenase family protein n=1 Tax=Nocardia vinacea TaxID=96468 RepID=UPI0002DD1981|nr:aldehyde dehydrogenase family protein [Nocardia vinacea]